MKFFLVVICVTQLICVNCKTLPEYFPEPCRKSDSDYTGCVLKSINKLAPYLAKGIPKYNIPKLEPLEVPVMIVNRTLNEFISIQAVIKNIKISGLSTIYINDLKTDLKNMAGEIRLTLPTSYLSMEYDVKGQLLTIPLENRGFFRGNFNDTSIFLKGNLKIVERDGVKYFALDKLKFKSRIGDGYIKLTAKKAEDQFAANLITNFVNDNPRRAFDAVNPLYVEVGTNFYRNIIEQGLAKVPADELLPE